MSLSDQIKNLFSRKPQEEDLDSRLSLAMPDESMAGNASETLAVSTAAMPLKGTTASAPLTASSSKSVAATQSGDGRDLITLPFLGQRSVEQHQRLVGAALGVSLIVLAGVTVFALSQSGKSARQLGVTAQALTQSQRLAKSATLAMAGNAQALTDVSESADILVRAAHAIDGDDVGSDLEVIAPLVDKTEKNARAILEQQKHLANLGASVRKINGLSGKLLESAQSVSNLKVQQGAAATEVASAGQLIMLTQRISKLANDFLIADAITPDAGGILNKDMASFKDVAQGLLNSARDSATRDALEQMLKNFEDMRVQAGGLLEHVPALGAARQAQLAIVADSEPLRRSLESVQGKLSGETGIGMVATLLMVASASLALLSAAGLSFVQLQESRRRQAAADVQRQKAEQQEQDAKRVNDANQAAILRLMNELQTVAEGDLTQEATVTEDITGAIADSVNYTVEELRSLVSNVQRTAAQVAQTTSDVDATSTELLAASKEQLHEIRETGQSVLEMAGRINNVSVQAQESARVARQSLMAAESGFLAVQNTIGGMNAIRDQIQETSKRIKRLGESSQEIGEITELISDITEQTNVLALNAAIQAASAGEAGRGFSVVAEEVQRLAERSADATRQIATLVKAIQTDTQDAIGAMERSTQGVVEGAKLSDNAGTALNEIDRVSRRVAELIEQISNAASREAGLANEVAENIQHIFAVTEQTGEGTRVTAGQVRELSRMADELRQSVQRFKIA